MNMYKVLGFTLIELLVVISIISIITLISYPALQNLFYIMEANKVERTFIDMMRTARAESYITKKDVMLCPFDETGQCNRAGTSGIMVFYDNNVNNRFDDADVLVSKSAWQIKRGSLLLRSSASRHYIRYMGDTSKPRGHMGHLRYCSYSNNDKLKFKVIYNAYGHLRVERQELLEVGC